MKNIKSNLVKLAVVLIILFLTKFWFKDKLITALGGYTHQTTTVTIDSTFVKGKIDTLQIFNHYVKTNGIILNPKPKIITNYIYKDTSNNRYIEIDSVKKYEVAVKDSLINGTVFVTNDFKGNLINANIEYKPLFPKLLLRTDTIYINKTTARTLENKRGKINLGIGLSTNNSYEILGGFTFKNNITLMYGLEKNFTTNKLSHSSKIVYTF